jgi:hypothetical protein
MPCRRRLPRRRPSRTLRPRRRRPSSRRASRAESGFSQARIVDGAVLACYFMPQQGVDGEFGGQPMDDDRRDAIAAVFGALGDRRATPSPERGRRRRSPSTKNSDSLGLEPRRRAATWRRKTVNSHDLKWLTWLPDPGPSRLVPAHLGFLGNGCLPSLPRYGSSCDEPRVARQLRGANLIPSNTRRSGLQHRVLFVIEAVF